jgi:hypothetical protein
VAGSVLDGGAGGDGGEYFGGVTRFCGRDGCGDEGGALRAGACEGEAKAGMSIRNPIKDTR